jgi:CHAT domain-containing protein
MVRIHEAGGDLSWAEAHRRALVELINQKGRAAHPANWGAFVFVGAP